MSDFTRSDEQRMLAEALGGALGIDADWQAAVVATGIDALGREEADGGLGIDLRDAAVVAAALGRAGVALPWAEHWVTVRLGRAAAEGPAASDAAGALGSVAGERRHWGEDALTVLHCAEIVGLCRTMMRDAATFSRERRQFGVAVGSFQALRHRMADMAMTLEQAAAITDVAIDTIDAPADERRRAVSAARVMCADAARLVGEGTVQVHGAMGLTAELRVGGFFRRARELAQRDGTVATHLRRYAA